jgi:peroxiredoxin
MQSVGAGDKIMMLADGNAQIAKAIGVDLDLTDKGLGTRSRRYAMLVDDQVCGCGCGCRDVNVQIVPSPYSTSASSWCKA